MDFERIDEIEKVLQAFEKELSMFLDIKEKRKDNYWNESIELLKENIEEQKDKWKEALKEAVL